MRKKEDPEDLGRITISHILIEDNKVVSGNVLRFLGKPLPQRLVTFDSIEINFINAEVIQLLQNWQPIFKSCPLNLSITNAPHFALSVTRPTRRSMTRLVGSPCKTG
ncbi:hypothetical protein niasHS_016653 [Heterodera schachtii]|uniref:Uncharacterized protein n=1 Tax=Heterodera schachtii TaxID=97005 RepID=A0ABD2HZ17_HETSC